MKWKLLLICVCLLLIALVTKVLLGQTTLYYGPTQDIAAGTATMTTAAISAGNCGTTVTVVAPTVLTTDTIIWSFAAAPAGTNAGLVAWPTAGNVNFAYCSNTAETPAAATINWKVHR